MSNLPFSQAAPGAREVLQDRDRLAEMYQTRTQEQIARELGTQPCTVRRALRYHNIPSHPRGWKAERAIVAPPRPGRRLTRQAIRRLVWRAYWRADRCPPDCPGREECLQGECKLGQILEGERNGNHDSD